MALQRRMRIVDADRDGPTAGGVKVAFATSDMQRVDQHFGSAESFALYAVDLDGARLLEVTQFGRLEQDGNEDKLAAKIEALSGVAAVYCRAVGASAVRQLLARGIQPVKVSEEARIAELIEALREELRAGPGAWLAKAIRRQGAPDVSRFDRMEEEGWVE